MHPAHVRVTQQSQYFSMWDREPGSTAVLDPVPTFTYIHEFYGGAALACGGPKQSLVLEYLNLNLGSHFLPVGLGLVN